MKRVFKYSFPQTDIFDLELPKGAEILTVQTQDGFPQLWAKVDDEADKEIRTFRLAGTGHLIEQEIIGYIGTFQMFGGSFVGHLFEIKQ